MKHLLLIFLYVSFFKPLPGQEKIPEQEKSDTSSLLYAFRKGTTAGHFRLYYMTTDNAENLSDYYAIAFGGGLKYQTRSFKGFQLGIGGFFIWNLSSSDLTQPDPYTGIMNRYEIGQFDQENPSNKKNLQRLEDFFVKYNFKKSYIRYGKQVLRTPFINPQDGRMRPTGEQGFWAEFNELKKTRIELGWLTHISPRGTVNWYRGAASLGIYPSGVATDGTKSNYKNNLTSAGTGIAGITYTISNRIKLQVWDHWVENIFNTVLLQTDADINAGKKGKIVAGFQYIHQRAINAGGHSDLAKTYFDPSQKVHILGARVGYKVKESELRFNYTRITRHGRFLFPREWGREPLYTFLPRERNEGLGDVNAFTVNFLKTFLKKNIQAEVSFGYYDVPDVHNFRLNKYGFPSYCQLNFNVKYTFHGWLKGLAAELLYLYKPNNGNTYNDRKYVINKVNMHQLNLILNYNF